METVYKKIGRQISNSFLSVSDQLCLDCDAEEDWNLTQGSHTGDKNLLHKAKGNCVRITDKIDGEYRMSFIWSVMS